MINEKQFKRVRDCGGQATLIYLAISMLGGGELDNKTISKESKVGPRYISRALMALEESGVVKIKRIAGDVNFFRLV
ncbi:MAG: hypothetical protein GY841_18570 [FCB group bacterium]|nr:hypothetical protein [FCB group bacterium]